MKPCSICGDKLVNACSVANWFVPDSEPYEAGTREDVSDDVEAEIVDIEVHVCIMYCVSCGRVIRGIVSGENVDMPFGIVEDEQ